MAGMAWLLYIMAFAGPGLEESWLHDAEQFMAEERVKWQVPGASVAVVRDGEIIFLKGFGYRDRETHLPVDKDTLFPIGSCTKAFTAVGIGILVDRGLLDWESRIVDLMPEFRMKDDFATQRMTPTDILCHRSGLPRHDLIWYYTHYAREELMGKIRYLEPASDFRTTFHYNNLMFTLAGYLAGRVAGTDWETFTRDNLLKPLAMHRTTPFLNEMIQDPNHAKPYIEKNGEVVLTQYKNIEAVGPSGSINSSAAEMANWLIMNLEEGRFEDSRIISKESLQKIHAPHIPFPRNDPPEGFPFKHDFTGSADYGLGWIVGDNYGTPVLEHRGGIDGYLSMMTLLPRQKAGIVVLTNNMMGGDIFVETVTRRLVDYLLEEKRLRDWSGFFSSMSEQGETVLKPEKKTIPATGPSHDLADYCGIYNHPGYGDLEISLRDNQLHLKYQQFQGSLTHLYYDIFGLEHHQIKNRKVGFITDKNGAIHQLTLALELSVDDMVFQKQVSSKTKPLQAGN